MTQISAEKHKYPFTVLESHLDTFGHMNHGAYLPILEEARWDLITAKGFGLNQIMETKVGPIILEVSIKFKRELKLRQKVIIETELLSMEKLTARMRQEIKDEEGKVYCVAELLFALFDMKERKLIPPTPEWLRAIGASES